MSLNWSIADVENYEEVTIVDDHNDPNFLEGLITKTLVFKTMTIGMNKITEKNYEEFFKRISMIQAIEGAPITRYVDGDHEDVFITLKDVKRRIGLGTNASEYTEHKFGQICTKVLREHAESRLWSQQRELEKEEEVTA